MSVEMLVIDNFIKDKKYLKILKDEKTWDGFPKYNWWDGWWVSKPRNLMEKVIETIWKKFGSFENTVAGFEYWTNTNSEKGNQSLEWHKDKDEKLFETTRKFLTCSDGLILYVCVENLEGGFLEISSEANPHMRINRERTDNQPRQYEDMGKQPNPWEIEPTIPVALPGKYYKSWKEIGFKRTHVERIKPIENRLIVFDPSKWHRVCQVSKGRRKAFLSNVWLKKPITFDNGDHVDKHYQSVEWVNEKKLRKV